MHYAVLVVLDPVEEDDEARTVETRVAEALRRFGDGLHWDWYEIGGRCEGRFDGSNVQPSGALTEEQRDNAFAVVVGGHWYSSEGYEPWQEDPVSMFPKRNLPPLSWLQRQPEYCGKDAEGTADVVILDCHN